MLEHLVNYIDINAVRCDTFLANMHEGVVFFHQLKFGPKNFDSVTLEKCNVQRTIVHSFTLIEIEKARYMLHMFFLSLYKLLVLYIFVCKKPLLARALGLKAKAAKPSARETIGYLVYNL